MWINSNMDPIEHIKAELQMIKLNEGDRYMDGFVTSKYKRQLLEVFWYLEDLLEDCDTYIGEDEWLEQRLKDKMLKKLGDASKK